MHSLGCRVVQLVLSRASEAALDAAVGPQAPDDVGQVVREEALLLGRRRKGKELLGVILQGAVEAQLGRFVVEPLLDIQQNP